MIKLATIQDIAKLIAIKDDGLEDSFSGSRGEVIQHLIQLFQNETTNLQIWINKDEDKINAYVIVLNNAIPPIANEVFIAHAYSKAGADITKKLLEAVILWARELRATKVSMLTARNEYFKAYGFEDTGLRFMDMVIDG